MEHGDSRHDGVKCLPGGGEAPTVVAAISLSRLQDWASTYGAGVALGFVKVVADAIFPVHTNPIGEYIGACIAELVAGHCRGGSRGEPEDQQNDIKGELEPY